MKEYIKIISFAYEHDFRVKKKIKYFENFFYCPFKYNNEWIILYKERRSSLIDFVGFTKTLTSTLITLKLQEF